MLKTEGRLKEAQLLSPNDAGEKTTLVQFRGTEGDFKTEVHLLTPNHEDRIKFIIFIQDEAYESENRKFTKSSSATKSFFELRLRLHSDGLDLKKKNKSSIETTIAMESTIECNGFSHD